MEKKISVNVKDVDGRPSVDPPEITLHPTDSVEWIAVDDDMTVGIPNRMIFGEEEIEIQKGGSGQLEVLEDAPEGRFPYAVFCHGGRCFAQGNSHPVMIIKKP